MSLTAMILLSTLATVLGDHFWYLAGRFASGSRLRLGSPIMTRCGHASNAEDLVRRTQELMNLGLRNFDAFHVASAEFTADVFATTDDRLLAFGKRQSGVLKVRVVDVVTPAHEVVQ